MAENTIIQQGRFTSTGVAKILQIRSDFDWIRVYNEAILYGNTDAGAEFYFQRGMTAGRGVLYTKLGASTGALTPSQIAAGAGFTMIDTTTGLLGTNTAVTNITTSTRPVLTTASTAALSSGNIVRLYNQSIANSLNGMDFVIEVLGGGVTFQLNALMANSPTAGGAETGTYRVVNFDPAWYPPYRTIVKISAAAQAVVTTSVPSQYKVGQEVTFNIPSSAWGMIEMDGLVGTVTEVNDTIAIVGTLAASSFRVNIDSSAFTAFVFPVHNATNRKERAIVAPVGIDTGYTLSVNGNILNDASFNTNFIGVKLAAGVSSPAGVDTNVIYWVAGKSFSVTNE